ncbi:MULTISPECIES: ABC transporter substrate-binding protein [unclassified Rhizobium]|uniref:ABC transporter substrate-binding protein n=1 Tax=unclassified Rhizobium TaxID=2613769 RepID=UPI000BC80A67|nr:MULTISPECIES: ABC transporter substrate-binding protein [unclassified Rhizobium]MDH7808770.1 putative spermidine/putrescine transport system substrate-binding protein [Rhizobium sp. AN67]MDQ4409194.1 ABC transporter substrate-binding protein [Rhizobium sp. AN63]SOD50921.1 putative spermidine/putrescine transport system substrate-binding protein [Rhizobium sp. AN6A]
MKYRFSMLVLSASAAVFSAGLASAEQVTFVSQGGAYQEAQTKAILDPVAKLLGITVNQDSAPDAWPVIKTQSASGKIVWDVIDTPAKDCIRGGKQGMIEKLDFSKIPNAEKMPAEYKSPYSVAYEFYSSVLAYNKDKFGGNPPKSWSDFWDVKKFPGTRALRNHPLATLEAALLADGVPVDKLYPLDVDRAFKKLEEIKPYVTVWWTSGAQSAQLLADGEVDMEMAWNGRVAAVVKEGAPIGYSFNEGFLQYTSLCILKGAPNLETAVKFVNAALTPEIQANFPAYIDYGPGNPEAYKTGKISPERAAEMPSSPNNAALQVLVSDEWWSSPAGEEAQKRWAQFIQK